MSELGSEPTGMNGGTVLYLLAFDHRSSFKAGLLGVRGEPDRAQHRQVSDLKALIYEGLRSTTVLVRHRDLVTEHRVPVAVATPLEAELSGRSGPWTTG